MRKNKSEERIKRLNQKRARKQKKLTHKRVQAAIRKRIAAIKARNNSDE